MKIIVVGDSLSAYSIASELSNEAHDITLIGSDKSKLKQVEEALDIQTVQGNFAEISTLQTAECEQADIIIAATESPETDILISLLATNLFQTPLTITILQEPLYQYRDSILKDLEDSTKHLWINPAELVTESITNLINYPGVQDLVKIQDNHHVLRTQIEDNHPLQKKTVKELEKQLPEHSTIVAVIRKGENLDLEHSITLKKDDQIIVACKDSQTKDILRMLTNKTTIHRVILAGITSISQALINKMPAHCSTKIIDNNLEKAAHLAQMSDRVTVLHGDINDTELLVTEKIDQTDAFFTLSHDDEDNLVAALQAKRHHVPTVASLVHRQEIAPIIDENNIHSIEPQRMLTNYIYQIIHHQTVRERHSLHQKAGEIISIKIPKSLDKCPLSTLKLPKHSQPFYLFREKKALPIQSSQILNENDTLCLYIKKPQDVKYVTEQLKVPKKNIFDILRFTLQS